MPQSPPPDFGDLLRDVARFADRADSEASTLESEQDRQMFARLVGTIREAHAKAGEIFPAAGRALHDLATEGKAQAEAAGAQIAEVVKKMQEMEAARAVAATAAAEAQSATAAPPTAAEPPIDPRLGAKLREELLSALLGPAPREGRAAPPGKDIWQDWK